MREQKEAAENLLKEGASYLANGTNPAPVTLDAVETRRRRRSKRPRRSTGYIEKVMAAEAAKVEASAAPSGKPEEAKVQPQSEATAAAGSAKPSVAATTSSASLKTSQGNVGRSPRQGREAGAAANRNDGTASGARIIVDGMDLDAIEVLDHELAQQIHETNLEARELWHDQAEFGHEDAVFYLVDEDRTKPEHDQDQYDVGFLSIGTHLVTRRGLVMDPLLYANVHAKLTSRGRPEIKPQPSFLIERLAHREGDTDLRYDPRRWRSFRNRQHSLQRMIFPTQPRGSDSYYGHLADARAQRRMLGPDRRRHSSRVRAQRRRLMFTEGRCTPPPWVLKAVQDPDTPPQRKQIAKLVLETCHVDLL